DGTSVATYTILQALMPSMFNGDEKANLTINKDYLDSAEVTGQNPQVVTFKINPKATWSDGKPITVKDFQAQAKALSGKNPKYQIASSTGYDRIKSVTQGADEREVVVTFAKPFAEWQSLFSLLYPAATNSDPTVFNKGWLNKIPVTAGPFKFDKFDKTAQTVTIVRDPKWWGDPAKLDRIITRSLDVDAGIGAFVNGEVDVLDIGIDPSGYKRAKGATGGVVYEAAGPDFRHFTINGTSPVMSDLNVRKAIAMGINRQAIAKADLTGLGDYPARTMDNHIFVNTQTGYQDNAGEVGKYNPDAAKQLLDQAGWKQAGPYRKKGGKTLTVRFIVPSGIALSKREGELTQAMLKDIGVKLNIVTVPADPFFDKYVVPGNYDITPFSWQGTAFPISPNQSIYAKPVKDAKGELQIQQNYARVGSDQIDKLMSDAEEQLDPAKARDLMNQADKLIWDEVHSLILYQRPQIWGVTKGLANVGAFGFRSPIMQDIGYVK
ncbi:MAG: glutathione transport system substrate-binding protein, partial [Thermoleophilaceae bacterium]|nr:glutathione transport system substrate-binding protein [Thermoleophilaceae bacterium]